MAENKNHFDLTLDTIAPEGSITRAFEYGNANANMPVTKGDASFAKFWFDGKAAGSKEDAGYAAAAWEPLADGFANRITEFTTDGTYYYHMVLMDSVNNESEVYNTALMNYDKTLPEVVSNTEGEQDKLFIQDPDSGSKEITNQRDNTLHFEYVDSGATASGVIKAYVTGNITGSPVTLNVDASGTYEGTFNFTDAAEEGPQTLSIVVEDRAGNQSVAKTVSITLDTQGAEGTLSLVDSTGAQLPEFINFTAIKGKISTEATDVVGYKIWLATETEPTSFTPATEYPVTKDLTLPVGDGEKIVHGKIIDRAGTETALTDVSVKLDQSAPTVTIIRDKEWISTVSGFDTAVLKMTGTDAKTTDSGVKAFTLKNGATLITSGAAVPATFDLTKVSGTLVEGANTITLEVEDVAGNKNSASVVVNLDTTVPTVSIGALETWYNADFDIQVTSGDVGAGVDKFYAWSSTVADDTTEQGSSIKRTGDSQTIAAASIGGTKAQSDKNYMHVKAVDAVGNVAYAHKQFGFDNVAPTKPSISFDKEVYGSVNANVTIVYSDATSGVAKMRVLGDITNGTATGEWEDATTARSVTLTAGDGIKKVTVQVMDNAGNTSEISAEASTELDTSAPAAELALKVIGTANDVPNHTNVQGFDAWVSCTDDDFVTGDFEYKLYGALTKTATSTTGITEAEAQWLPLTAEQGRTHLLVEGYYFTNNDPVGEELKEIYVKVKDAAGNESPAVKVSRYYDNGEPEVEVSDVDYHIISKIHSLRRSGSSEVEGKYADMVHFTFKPNEPIQAWKACAYMTKELAAAGSHADAEIEGMSATGLSSDAAISTVVYGDKYEKALNDGKGTVDDHSFDGAHFVVVYVQDLGGTWSKAATFTA